MKDFWPKVRSKARNILIDRTDYGLPDVTKDHYYLLLSPEIFNDKQKVRSIDKFLELTNEHLPPWRAAILIDEADWDLELALRRYRDECFHGTDIASPPESRETVYALVLEDRKWEMKEKQRQYEDELAAEEYEEATKWYAF